MTTLDLGPNPADPLGMYRALHERLTAMIGPEHATIALREIGTHAILTAKVRILSPALHTYGRGLAETGGLDIPNE